MFAAIFVLAAVGVSLTMATLALERWTLHWHESVRSTDTQTIT
jgi:ABC-type nitrate/sulfonate/bicarbonate transport system permease component